MFFFYIFFYNFLIVFSMCIMCLYFVCVFCMCILYLYFVCVFCILKLVVHLINQSNETRCSTRPLSAKTNSQNAESLSFGVFSWLVFISGIKSILPSSYFSFSTLSLSLKEIFDVWHPTILFHLQGQTKHVVLKLAFICEHLPTFEQSKR